MFEQREVGNRRASKWSEVKRDFVAKIKGKTISQVLVEFVFYL